ncbi:hypothetical protein COW36_16845 [bacterium (Candidatus Blackallbacteria) CG17_big_fil_post_rev_8_21_14_2_50_48_46]|uniref:Uncharacterized protein n=1 Tax=bacterium (Candidatus Blackallbacteria) CG17_big_fil_post_rev_8_21_14_2_50_48_46 TaxID=2014261 RepID=A0A2M7G1P2_9BACT|nr:MAG: hypothetical protein COW64_22345 [bacterium (Candidatus Blackallbacteria) CG18_big_fil_WC_8_21_14_2_50_49_26]PIW15544.1 MAG: hypothetical protein COW36_16845 [bacterium (Candidatus Blackallbacteria) CG17_big_fil_post_rev_8_21_14_2_50_48_46]PIW50286.1 MAG: hypothetical protein COW20_03110 [bacterium (Candidatus Blackallbacteria) CG13_big_fil_rev_8_21_14_2_50_49_14]
MFQMKEIQLLQQQSSGFHSQRHDQAEEDFFFGLMCLDRFATTGYQDSDLLKEACRKFIQSIQSNGKDERPHLALAYLFALIEDYPTAQLYLASAEGLAIDHPMIAAIRKIIREIQKMSTDSLPEGPQADSAALSAEDLDYDALYDEVEDDIKRWVLEFSQHLNAHPSLRPDIIKNQRKTLEKLRETQDVINAKITRVEEEIDTTELVQALKPLEISQKRLEQALQTTVELQALQTEMHNTQSSVGQISQEAQQTEDAADIPVLEENIEVLLDHCDHFADQLDQYSERQLDLEILLKTYDRLVGALDDLRNLVDDTIERLKGKP